MKIYKCEQRSQEWYNLRCGVITSTGVYDIIPGKNRKYKKARRSYLYKLLSERLTGETKDIYLSREVERGKEKEKIARSAYEVHTRQFIQEVGFVIHDNGIVGCSPDGLLPDRGIEIKCPDSKTHLETVIDGKIKSEYYTQMQVCMMCTGLQQWDFVSFDDRLPEYLQLHIISIPRNEEYCNILEREISKFFDELMNKIIDLTLVTARTDSEGIVDPG